ncbi:MAG TPA: hypothetical protein VK426_04990 [Methanobacterium sp.]|nr:hypothetical protein [Methanobacterium sp.]
MAKMSLDENAKQLIKKCEEDKELASEGMGACQVMLEEMDKGNLVMDDETGQSYLEMAQNIKPEDVPKVLKIAFLVRDSSDISDANLKNAAARLIRAMEML